MYKCCNEPYAEVSHLFRGSVTVHFDVGSGAAVHLGQFSVFSTWSMGYRRREMYWVNRLALLSAMSGGENGRIVFTSQTRVLLSSLLFSP